MIKARGSKNDVTYFVRCVVRRNRNEHPPSQCKPTFCCTLILHLQTICEIPHRQTITRFSSQMGMLHIRHLRADIFACKVDKQIIMTVEFASKWNFVHNPNVAGVAYDMFFGCCVFPMRLSYFQLKQYF